MLAKIQALPIDGDKAIDCDGRCAILQTQNQVMNYLAEPEFLSEDML